MEALLLGPPLSQRPHAPAVNRYELRSELARGGMATIFLAYDRLAEREIAYKRLSVADPRRAGQLAALFEREYNTLARLAHPNIVRVYEYGIDAQAPYYTMELLPGRDLFNAAPLPVFDACRVARDLASALALVHTRRLVHRDVSPLNVRLTDGAKVKLIDFGALARFGRVHEAVGTPGFVAPECFDTRQLDGRTDLYSLGALLYWALTRKMPLQARSFSELRAAFSRPVAPPSQHRPEIPRALDELILSLLHNDPLARPNSAFEVIDRLTQLADLPPEEDEARVAYSYLRHPPLVGRDEVSRDIGNALDGMLNGRGRTVLIQGMAGTGKTALLDQVGLEAQLAGAAVLRAQGSSHSGAFGPATALARTALALRHESGRGTSPSLFPELSQRDASLQASRSPAEVVDLHTRKVGAIQRCLLELSQTHPVVILVDDVHRSDPESVAVLASLSQALGREQLLLVMTTSEDRAAEAGALSTLGEAAVKLQLRVLDRDHVVELVGSLFGGVPNANRLGLWLYTQSGGNPARCLELLQALLRTGWVKYVSGTFTLPYEVAEDVLTDDDLGGRLHQLANLSDNARAVAKLLSLQLAAISLDELTAASQLRGRDLLPALDDLRQQGLICMVEEQVAFVSEALREAVESSLDGQERRQLHLRIAHSLLDGAARDHNVAMLAGAHLLKAGDEEKAAALFMRATQSRTLGAESIGTSRSELLETALSTLGKQGRSDEQCLGLLVPLAHLGYFRDYRLQVRYLPRALAVLSRLCGVSAARRLRPFLGAKLALYLGLACALLRHLLTPRRRRATSFKGLLRDLITLANTGQAAALCAFDFPQAQTILDTLSPFAAARTGTAPWLAYQFALAAFELASGRSRACAERYVTLLRVLDDAPIRGLDDAARQVYRLACLYGRAQGELTTGSAVVRELADELSRGHPFFASHAESTHMMYYGLRGEQERAEAHRARAEVAALRGGMSWSAVTVLVVRSTYLYAWSRNAVGLLRNIAELDRLAKTAPAIQLFRDAARGYLALLRGRADQALRLYERVLSDARFPALPSGWIDRAHYAQALCSLGRFEEARHQCQRALQDARQRDDSDVRTCFASQQLALAEAGLGQLHAAKERLDLCRAQLAGVDSPLLIGSLHRDIAQVALIARDKALFAEHLEAMSAHFRRTGNPWLIRQCDQLAAEAKRADLGIYVQLPGASLAPEALAALRDTSCSGIHSTEDDVPLPPTEAEGRFSVTTTVIE